MPNVARVGDTCPIAGCGTKVVKFAGPSTVCERGHHLVNPDSSYGKEGTAAKSKREREAEDAR